MIVKEMRENHRSSLMGSSGFEGLGVGGGSSSMDERESELLIGEE